VTKRRYFEPLYLNAPLAHKALIKIANNSVGAASNKTLDEGGVCSYNDIKINFVELLQVS
jgi:hypothetical protein